MESTKLSPNLSLEKTLSDQIYNALQGPVVEKVLKLSKTSSCSDNYWKNTMEGHSFKVEEKLLGRLHKLFYEVKDTLGFKENVDFYITVDSSVNAFAVSAENEGEPHIVNVNSALIQLPNDEQSNNHLVN